MREDPEFEDDYSYLFEVAEPPRRALRPLPNLPYETGTRTAPLPARPAVERFRKRMLLGSAGLAVGTVAVAAATFLGLQAIFPWLALHPDADDNPPIPDAPTATARLVSGGDVTPAERVVNEVLGTDLPSFEGWKATDEISTISSPSLGFGCDPKDGLAPVTAASKTVSNDSTTVTISVRAYPAAGGALAVDGIEEAAHICDAAWVETPTLAPGIDVTQVRSRHVSTLVWRRGDVLVLVSTNNGSPSTYSDAVNRLDDTLESALVGSCVDPNAGVEQAPRSPYLNRSRYEGHFRAETVARPPVVGKRTAEDRSTAPVVDIPAPAVTQPVAGDRPPAPYPAPLTGPTTLPDEVLPAVMPEAPVAPAKSARVARAVPDAAGPGCGWAFTGQVAPAFDSDKAEAAYARAAAKTERRLLRAWRTWQHEKVAYYSAYAAYLEHADVYNTYVLSLAKVRDAWAVIETARSEYYAALAVWQESVTARKEWKIDRAEAKALYEQTIADCAEAELDPEYDPTLWPECPAERPAILDETAPDVPEKPEPSPEAQLRY